MQWLSAARLGMYLTFDGTHAPLVLFDVTLERAFILSTRH